MSNPDRPASPKAEMSPRSGRDRERLDDVMCEAKYADSRKGRRRLRTCLSYPEPVHANPATPFFAGGTETTAEARRKNTEWAKGKDIEDGQKASADSRNPEATQ